MKRLTLFFLCLITSIGWAAAQNRIVKGTVTSSEDNEPIIGANVVVVGHTTIGAQTDLDGNFTIPNVPADAKQLRFTYTGMTPKVVSISNVMNVVLDPDAAELETVVVLGYGTGQKLSTVSGSVARVSSEKLAEKPVSNVMDALQGQVAGMQVMTTSGDPTQVASVAIHGRGSLTASSAPLYIVDGMQTDLSVVATMNPNDFESMTVLKDASSTSIYGARAANGVIIITTKRGKMGERGRVSFNAMYGVSTIINKRPMKDMMTGAEHFKYQYDNKHYGTPSESFTIQDAMDKVQKTAEDLWKEYPLLAAGLADGTLKPVDFSKDADWLEYFIRPTAPTTQGDLNFQGGSQGTSYFASISYFNQEGISREPSLFKRYSGRVNLDSRVNDWLKIGINLSGAFANREASTFAGSNYYNTGTFGAYSMPKFFNPFTSNGGIAEAYFIFGSTDPFQSPERQAKWYPYEERVAQANVGGYIQLNPIKGLTLKAQAGTDYTDVRTESLSLPNNPLRPGAEGQRRERSYHTTLKTFTNTAEYKWNMDDMHDFTLLAGHEFVDYDHDWFGALAKGLESSKLLLLSHGKADKYLTLPEQVVQEYAYLSFFGRLSYALDNWAFLDLSLRNDKSSRFGKNKQSATFFSVGTMIDIYSKFIKESSWLNDLRFKASYGTTGNSEIGNNYAHYALLGNNPYSDQAMGLSVASAGNPDLSWEQQSQLNIGLNGAMFNSRLNAELDFYVRTTDDMLLDVPLPYSSGFTSQLQNVGALRNVGFDINLKGDIYKTKDLHIWASTNFNYNVQTITKLFYGLDEYLLPNTGTIWQVGKANAFYMAEYAGIDKEDGMQMWYVPGEFNDDGSRKTTKNYSDKLEHAIDKNVTPPITGGFSFGGNWKGVSLEADFAYIIGKWMINNDRYFTENGNTAAMGTNKSKILLDAWTPENTNTDVPKLGQAPQFDTHLLENASFLRLKNLKLGYDLPSSIFEGQNVFTGVRLYVMARNLFTVTKYKGFDPEAGGNVALNQFPNTRQYMAGVQVSF